MAVENIQTAYKIDEERLIQYYERIKNQSNREDQLIPVAKFLNYQSIGNSFEEVHEVLKYFKDKLAEGKTILDLAFEWVRAQKIRLEYKKYLIRALYPDNDLCLAIDDCIYKYFLDYDTYIRHLFKPETREHNFSALYEVFFCPFDRKEINIEAIMKKHLQNIPTHYCGSEKINTRIMTLRSGFANIIVKDYEDVLFARKEEEQIKACKANPLSGIQIKKISREFNGTNIERIIKTYCFNKIPIINKSIESAIVNFLNSYFEFGVFFKFDDFKEQLLANMADFIYAGLTENLKEKIQFEKLKALITETIEEFRRIHKIEVLDGSAWSNDLKPILISFLRSFCTNLF